MPGPKRLTAEYLEELLKWAWTIPIEPAVVQTQKQADEMNAELKRKATAYDGLRFRTVNLKMKKRNIGDRYYTL